MITCSDFPLFHDHIHPPRHTHTLDGIVDSLSPCIYGVMEKKEDTRTGAHSRRERERQGQRRRRTRDQALLQKNEMEPLLLRNKCPETIVEAMKVVQCRPTIDLPTVAYTHTNTQNTKNDD